MVDRGKRRRIGLLVAGLLAAGTIGAVPAVAGANDTAADLIEVAIGDLHPTQSAIGYDEIYYKLGRYRSDKDEQAGHVNKRFDDWCEANGQEAAASAGPESRLDAPGSFTCTVPVGQETDETLAEMKTVVLGPGDVPYLTDGHHSLTALLESPDGGPATRIRVRVAADLSDLDPARFWAEMESHRWVWLRDADDQPITPEQLSTKLGMLGDDQYRGLVYFTRDIGYEKPGGSGDDADGGSPEFLEFYWARWLRQSYDLSGYDLTDHATYLDLIEQASKDMAALADDDPVADGRTAGELGKMPEWNDGKPSDGGEFADLAKPLSDPKPGKLAYALDYKTRGRAPGR